MNRNCAAPNQTTWEHRPNQTTWEHRHSEGGQGAAGGAQVSRIVAAGLYLQAEDNLVQVHDRLPVVAEDVQAHVAIQVDVLQRQGGVSITG